MNELLSFGLWPRIRKFAKRARRMSAAVAYVTDDRYLKFSEGDILVTDASDEAIKSGQTSVSVLKAALKRRARIASVSGLHSKVYVFDRYAVIGSANLSKESERRTEAALLTDLPTVVSSARLLIETLMKRGVVVDEEFISRISKLPVTARKAIPSGAKHQQADDGHPRTWLIGLKPVQEKEEEQAVALKGLEEAEKCVREENSFVSRIRFRGNSLFRREAQKGDVVICIWTEEGKAKPSSVYHHADILHRENDEVNDVTWFYIEEYPDAHETTLTWKQFQKLYLQVGMTGKPSQWASREISQHHSDAIHNLWFSQ